MRLAERKSIELTNKRDSLVNELADWQARSEPKQPLRKHYTQILRLTQFLASFQKAIDAEFAKTKDAPDARLASCRRLERMILEAHRLWGVFRDKLALRDVALFQDYLLAADQFAWECYEPLRQNVVPAHRALEDRKEPPLVFFHSLSSPVAKPRGLDFSIEVAPGDGKMTARFEEAILSLPVTLIGIPWFQTQHLPDLLIVGHEVGHCVEYDFGLQERLQALLKGSGLPSTRRPAWLAWRSEVFADLFGVLAAGPAFVSSLMNFLALDTSHIEKEWRDDENWTTYPTSYLRILLCLQALRHLHPDYAATANTMEATWKETYPAHALPEFAEDIPAVVTALYDGPYPELKTPSLTSVLNFLPVVHTLALTEAKKLRKEVGTDLQDVRARVQLAAAQLAYVDDPGAYAKEKAGPRILDWIKKQQDDSTRGTRSEAEQRPKQEMLAQQQRDAAKARQLFDSLFPAD